YLSSAISSLWPSCSATYYDGSTWPTFISALTGSDWSMCIVAAINYTSTTSSDWAALVNWYTDYAKLHFFDWATNYGYSTGLINAMGASSPVTMGFTASHYVWDSGHDIVQGIDPWTLDMHGWGFGVYHERYNWSTASPVTGWTASETANQAGILEAENEEGVITGLYESFIGGGQEQQLWENVLDYMWTGGWIPGEPPYVTSMDPDDGDTGVPVDTDIVFHCVHDIHPVDTDTIVFTVEDTSRRSGGRALGSDSTLAVGRADPRPTGEISGTLGIDATDPKDVLCTFTPDEDLPVDLIRCTVAAGLADNHGHEMPDDFVWTFTTGNYSVEDTTWGAIKAGL
ncbi:MAG TPA: Ig-like domain-containing protein, partial [bacterium]|nr:Ig-like domain-containing protein [bacterium]